VGLERILRIYFLQQWFNLSDPGVEEALYDSLAQVNRYLEKHGLKIVTGTILDATLLGAPSWTKNQSGERDPEMRSTRKNGQWHFGMKAHGDVDAETKLIHSAGPPRPTSTTAR
jgi:IS5 family transposase